MGSASPVTLVILLPTPGKVFTPFFKSMIGLTQALPRRGIGFAIKTFEFSDVVMSRNYLMSYFLSQEQFSHALLLDCDLEFAPDQVFRLLDFGAECAIAPYPRRQMSLRGLTAETTRNEARPEDKRLTPEQVLARSLGHVVQKRTAQPGWKSKRKGDFVTLPGAGMGFTLISRSVPETLVDKGTVEAFPEQGKLPLHAGAPRFYNFFNHLVSADGKYILGEDQSFFHRWVFGCGGDVWADSKARLVHHGSYGFQGDFEAELTNPD